MTADMERRPVKLPALIQTEDGRRPRLFGRTARRRFIGGLRAWMGRSRWCLLRRFLLAAAVLAACAIWSLSIVRQFGGWTPAPLMATAIPVTIGALAAVSAVEKLVSLFNRRVTPGLALRVFRRMRRKARAGALGGHGAPPPGPVARALGRALGPRLGASALNVGSALKDLPKSISTLTGCVVVVFGAGVSVYGVLGLPGWLHSLASAVLGTAGLTLLFLSLFSGAIGRGLMRVGQAAVDAACGRRH